jgi:PHD/YefM family antitoxin component YafN of YafNO toxin-antitoxin module
MAKMANHFVRESTMRVTATEAKNRFGSLCAQAKREPVFVEKAGQLDSVILSAEQYQALQAGHDKASHALRKKAFEAEFGDWIAAQNARVEAHGIPGADLRPW